MKVLFALAIALQGAAAFPKVMNSVLADEHSFILEGRTVPKNPKAQEGCKTSSLCDKSIDVTDADIDYDPSNPTETQKISAARTNCGFLEGPCRHFDATKQKVSTTGKYAYKAPELGQIRGPCPGLNAASNHAYLPRSGLATIGQTISGLGHMYGMSIDLAAFLAAYAIVFDGDLVTRTWSIGGPLPEDILSKTGLLARPQGISYSHNKYEGDTSIGRCDAYINNGDAHSLSVQRFKYAYEAGIDNDRYTLDKFVRNFAKNTIRSEATNPAYFAPLFSTTLVSPAAYNFVINFMSNHSAEEPSGYLNGEMFKQFFGITGEYPNFKWIAGQERMPENWYRRPYTVRNSYNAVAGVFGDLIPGFLAYPKSFRFGGNTNGVNTYTGIDISNFTNGVYTADNLFKGDNLACFLFQTEQQAIPDQLQGGFNAEGAALRFISKALGNAFGDLDCPKLQKFGDNPYGAYPGSHYQPHGEATTC